MDEELDEFGIPIKKVATKEIVDEFGIPLKKKVDTLNSEDSKNPSKPTVLKESLDQKKPASPYQTPDIQSQSKLDGSSLESIPSQSGGIESKYSFTPSYPKNIVESTNEVMSPVDKLALKAKDLRVNISTQQKELEGQTKQILDVFNRQKSELSNFESQLNDPNIPTEAKDMMLPQYEQLKTNAYQNEKLLKDNVDKYYNIEKAKSHLDQIEDIKLTNDARKNTSPAKAVGNFMAHVYNSVPETISGVGALLESAGQGIYNFSPAGNYINTNFDKAIKEAKTPKQKAELENTKKYISDKATSLTDAVGGAINQFGDALKIPTDKKYDEEHYIASTIGDIVGSIAVSAIPGSIAAKAGKTAQIITGATTAAMQTADGIHQEAKDLGLSNKDAANMTLAIAPVSGLLEVWGASNIINNVTGKKMIKELVSESAKKLAGKEVTKEAVFGTVSDTFKEIGKKYGANILTSSGEEGLTEGLQAEIQAGAENVYDKLKGEKKYGTDFFSSKTQLDVAKQAAIGMAAGGFFGMISGISDKKSMYETAQELKRNPEQLLKFKERLASELKLGNITQEQVDNIRTNINSLLVLDDKIPDSIKKTERRVAAVNLLSEKAKLEQEIEGKDKALTVKKRERIDEIDQELEGIARGKKLTDAPQKEVETPVIEKKEIKVDENKPNTSLSKEEEEDIERLTFKKELGNISEADNALLDELVNKKESLEYVDPKSGNGDQIFPSLENKEISEKKTINSNIIDNRVVQENYSEDKKSFISDKIQKLKDTGDFEESFMSIYTNLFAEKYEKSREKQNNNGTETESNKEDSSNNGADKTTGNGGGRGRIAKEKRKIKDPRHIEALKHEVNSPYDLAMQYFINKGKVKNSAITDVFGVKAESEKRVRIGLQNKETGKSIDELAHHLWQQDDRFSTQDYKDAIESVIIENTTPSQMAERINEKYSESKLEMSEEDNAYYTELDKINEGLQAEDYWDKLTDEEKDILVSELEEPKESISDKAKRIADKIRESGKFFDDKTTSAIPLLKQAWKASHEVAAKIVEAGGTVADATLAAIEDFKASDFYKSLTDKSKKSWINDLTESLSKTEQVKDGKTPQKPKESIISINTESKNKALSNIKDPESDNVKDSISEYIQGLFNGTKREANNSTYIRTKSKIDGKSVVFRVSNHYLNSSNIDDGEYVISLQIENKEKYNPNYFGDQIKEEHGDNYVNLVVPGDVKYLYDILSEIDDKLEAIKSDSKFIDNNNSKGEEVSDISKDITKTIINDGKTPNKLKSERVRALATELSEAKNIPEETRNKIKESGLTGQVFSHEEAKQIANEIIKTEGVEIAVDLANRKLKGSVKAFVFGAAIDHYSKMVDQAKTQQEKDEYAELGAEVAAMFESNAEDYGRFISAIGKYYKNHPDIILRRETKKLELNNKKYLEDKITTSENISKVKSEFEKLKKEFDEKVDKKVNEEFNKIGEKLFGKEAIQKVDDAFDDIISQIKSGTYASIIPPPVLIGALNIVRLGVKGGMGLANAINSGINYIKENFKGDFNEKELTEKLTKTFENLIPKEVSSNKEAISKPKVKKQTDLKEEQEKILNKYFPKKITESATKRKQLHEKIIDQYNAGVFEGGLNKDGQTFESLFYEKLGIVNPKSQEVQSKIKEFVDKMAKAPEGSIMWREANQDMLNYLANLAYESKIKSGASKLDAMWYANILSSPATHLRNLQFNIIQTMIANPLLLAQKALINKDPKAAASIFADMFKGLGKGLVEGSRALKTGRGTRFDVISASPITERGSKFMKFFSLPGKALKASDILFTDAAYNTKQGEFARNIVKKEHPDWNNDQVNIKVNELLGNTKERKQAATEKAEKELEDFYGPDWRQEKGIKEIQKIREFELMEESMPEEMKGKLEEAMAWSKRSVLTSKPTGIYGDIADLVQKMNDKLWFTKFVMPFVNVPLNVVQQMLEKSPAGIIKAVIGKEKFGFGQELTKDQKQELLLKGINYTILIAALASINGDDDDDELVVTGQQTGDYQDNKGIIRGGKLEPYSVYINGKKVLNYKTTPWAALFVPVGYMRDYKLYGKNEGVLQATANSFVNYLLYANEQSAMQGVSGMFEAVANAKKADATTVGQSFSKLASGFIPYSGAVKYITNTTNAALGETDKRPIDWYENLYRDLPLATFAMKNRSDHFGQPVKENFDIPFVPIGDRGLVMEISDKSKYYKLTSDHKYFPTFTTNRKLYVDGKEVDISKRELDDLNVRRGQLVKKALDSKNIFQLKDDNLTKSDQKEANMSTYDYLNSLDNEEFKDKMDDIFKEATKYAKLELYGEKVGITKAAIEKYKKQINEMKKKGYSERFAEFKVKSPNEKIKEESDKHKKDGLFTIEVDNY